MFLIPVPGTVLVPGSTGCNSPTTIGTMVLGTMVPGRVQYWYLVVFVVLSGYLVPGSTSRPLINPKLQLKQLFEETIRPYLH